MNWIQGANFISIYASLVFLGATGEMENIPEGKENSINQDEN